MDCIYIVFSSTPYRIGRMIRMFTRDPYNHVSISLDENLTQMYGFARRYYRTPFYGGFVREAPCRYHVGGKSAHIRVCRLPVTAEQYQALQALFSGMLADKEQYPYNYLSATTAILRRSVKVKDAYTCVEFCVQVLSSLGLELDPDRFYTVGDLEQMLQSHVIYSGPMPISEDADCTYFARRPVPHPALSTFSAIATLFKRLV